MVVAEQAESATLSYPRPVTSAAMRWSKTTASAIRGLWQPSGWVSTWSGREARNSTRIGSSTHDGKTGTGKPSVTERQQLHDNGVPCPLEIGRASCRERVLVSGWRVCMKKESID